MLLCLRHTGQSRIHSYAPLHLRVSLCNTLADILLKLTQVNIFACFVSRVMDKSGLRPESLCHGVVKKNKQTKTIQKQHLWKARYLL